MYTYTYTSINYVYTSCYYPCNKVACDNAMTRRMSVHIAISYIIIVVYPVINMHIDTCITIVIL